MAQKFIMFSIISIIMWCLISLLANAIEREEIIRMERQKAYFKMLHKEQSKNEGR